MSCIYILTWIFNAFFRDLKDARSARGFWHGAPCSRYRWLDETWFQLSPFGRKRLWEVVGCSSQHQSSSCCHQRQPTGTCLCQGVKAASLTWRTQPETRLSMSSPSDRTATEVSLLLQSGCCWCSERWTDRHDWEAWSLFGSKAQLDPFEVTHDTGP